MFPKHYYHPHTIKLRNIIEITKKISDESARACALSEIAVAWIKFGDVNKAYEAVNMISNPILRDQALELVASALLEKVREVRTMISNEYTRQNISRMRI